MHDKTLRRIVNIPTYEMAHASLLIEIEKPEIDLSGVKTGVPDINIENALSNVDTTHRQFLNATQVIRETLQTGRLTQELAGDNFGAIETVAPIVPRQNSFFDALEINGRHPDRTIRPLIIDAAQGKAIREIYESARSALRTIDGEIVIVNAHTYQFTLTDGARNITCVGTTDAQKARIPTLQNGDRATVRGYLTPRVQRDLMQIQTMTVDGFTTG